MGLHKTATNQLAREGMMLPHTLCDTTNMLLRSRRTNMESYKWKVTSVHANMFQLQVVSRAPQLVNSAS